MRPRPPPLCKTVASLGAFPADGPDEVVRAALPARFFADGKAKRIELDEQIDEFLEDFTFSKATEGIQVAIDEHVMLRSVETPEFLQSPDGVDVDVYEASVVGGVTVITFDSIDEAARRSYVERFGAMAMKDVAPPMLAAFDLPGTALIVIPNVAFSHADLAEAIEAATHDALVRPLVNAEVAQATLYEATGAIARRLRNLAALESVSLHISTNNVLFCPQLVADGDEFVAHGYALPKPGKTIERGTPFIIPSTDAIKIDKDDGEHAFQLLIQTFLQTTAHRQPTAAAVMRHRLNGLCVAGKRQLPNNELCDDFDAIRLKPLSDDVVRKLARINGSADAIVAQLAKKVASGLPRAPHDLADTFNLENDIRLASESA